jgi:sialate O-acetylesterase
LTLRLLKLPLDEALMSLAMILITCLRLSIGASLATTPGVGPGAEKVHVACIGDSITFGLGIKDREHACYPARLASLLGDRYEVRNFGVSGATVIKRGTRPYHQQDACRDALKYRPQVAVVMLGTNDTNKQTWQEFKQDFAADYSNLIAKIRAASPDVQIWICVPPPLVRDRGKDWDTDAILTEQIVPQLKSIAQKSTVGLIDLNSIFAKRSALLPDGVHSDAEGADLIARTVYESVQKQLASKSSHE